MDFSVIFQLRTKKFWWMDVIFYFVISLLIATIFCYLIFLIKNNIQREEIEKETLALQTVGTTQQKEYEENVTSYQKKIIDYADILKNHEFASNVFAFMQEKTMPNIWFKQFALDRRNSGVQLSGEADNLDALSRQVAGLEKNRYVKSVTALNSSLGVASRIGFNINLVLDQNIFGYLVDIASISETVTMSDQPLVPENQATPEAPVESSALKSSEKLITSFHILLNPEVAGIIDETTHTITADVPYNADIKSLMPSIVASSGATVLPASETVQNFENPVIYTVVARDGSTQDYVVSANRLAQPEPEKASGKVGTVIFIVILLIVLGAAIFVFFFLRKRSKNKANEINNI